MSMQLEFTNDTWAEEDLQNQTCRQPELTPAVSEVCHVEKLPDPVMQMSAMMPDRTMQPAKAMLM